MISIRSCTRRDAGKTFINNLYYVFRYADVRSYTMGSNEFDPNDVTPTIILTFHNDNGHYTVPVHTVFADSNTAEKLFRELERALREKRDQLASTADAAIKRVLG